MINLLREPSTGLSSSSLFSSRLWLMKRPPPFATRILDFYLLETLRVPPFPPPPPPRWKIFRPWKRKKRRRVARACSWGIFGGRPTTSENDIATLRQTPPIFVPFLFTPPPSSFHSLWKTLVPRIFGTLTSLSTLPTSACKSTLGFKSSPLLINLRFRNYQVDQGIIFYYIYSFFFLIR